MSSVIGFGMITNEDDVTYMAALFYLYNSPAFD